MRVFIELFDVLDANGDGVGASMRLRVRACVRRTCARGCAHACVHIVDVQVVSRAEFIKALRASCGFTRPFIIISRLQS